MLIYLIILGSCLGSFFSAYIYRYPLGISMINKGSQCVGCNHKLCWLDLIPIISWLLLRGRCRYCKMRISITYLINELVGAVIFGTIFIITDSLYLTVLYGSFLSIIITLSWLDALTQTVPIPLLVCLVPIALMMAQNSSQANQIFSLLLVLVPFGICYLLFPNQIGIGDIIYMTIASVILYPRQLLLSLLISCLFALIYLFWAVKTKRKFIHDSLPFVPFLSIGICLVLFL
jgi:Type II secretory pathway, prepilin signal peptidase PulO and related peptidases